MQAISKFQIADSSDTNKNGLIKSKTSEKAFDFLEAFKNMYIPALVNGKHQYRVPYEEFVKCLESLSYRVVTTKEEYYKRRESHGSVGHAWCPLNHSIVEVHLSRILTRHSTFCNECGQIKGSQTRAANKAKKEEDKAKKEADKIKEPDSGKGVNKLKLCIQPASEKEPEFHVQPDSEKEANTFEPVEEIVPTEPVVEKEFDFIEAFKNCFIPNLLGDSLRQTPYEDAVRCLESLSYKVVTTKEEYEQRERASILRAWCPMRHSIVEIRLSELIREQKPHCDECVKIKKKQINLRRYNVEHVLQSEEVRENGIQTLQENYAVTNPMKSAEIATKAKETCKEKFGHENAMQNEDVKAKVRETCQERFGHKHPMQNEQVKAKTQETCQERYGVRNPMHHPEIFKKNQEARFQCHDYVLPSGKIILYQGYEHFCLDELLKNEGINEDDIVTPHYQNEKLPKVLYWDDEAEKNRKYYPDFYIPSLNKIIEVKCTYTYEDEKYFRINQLKAQTCKKLGYNFEFRIYNKQGKIERLITI